MHNIKNHEYSLGELLFHSWNLFIEHFFLFLILGMIIHIPLNILVFMASGMVVSAFSFILVPISVMAIAYSVNKILNSKKITWQEALNESLDKLFWAWGTNILLSLFLFGLFMLFVVPGVIYFIYWQFIIHAVILRKKYGFKALAYSKSLVKGRWWKVFGFNLVLSLLIWIPFFLIKMPFASLHPDALFEVALTPYPSLDVMLYSLMDIFSIFLKVVFAVFFINLDHTKLKLKEIPSK